MAANYIFTNQESILVKNAVRDVRVGIKTLKDAVQNTNKLIADIAAFEVDIFSILGMRNLSAFMGELFARSLIAVSGNTLIGNPHQDGYPDILVLDEAGKKAYDALSDRLRDKLPFSPFVTGGIEVKATCGSVPSPAKLHKKGLEKPGIGDQRIELLTGYDWKAHHRETNNLLAILWDFVDGKPIVCAVFYSASMSEDDWGAIVQPKAGGGRTTSVSIMNRRGIRKLYDGWICVLDDDRYSNFLNKYNRAALIHR